jgi:uncharacterized protein with FMN-binding domain
MHKSIKPLVALVLTGIGSALVFGFKTTDPVTTTSRLPTATASGLPTATTAPTSTTAPTTTAPRDAAPAAGQSATAAPTVGPTATTQAKTGQYADGTFAGAAVSEPWGTFEVEAIVSGGQLTDVQLVSAPRDRHSTQINAVAVPLLTESAIAGQSANVDVVSGATWTSDSYAQSLQAALDAAAVAAITEQAAG